MAGARPATLAGALKRRLLAQPGISARPTCPACGQERDPGDFLRAGRCRPCQSGLDHADLGPDGRPTLPPTRDTMVDRGPFLPEDV